MTEVHQFPRNSVMEFSEYLQGDRMAHWPRFLRHPVLGNVMVSPFMIFAVFDVLLTTYRR